jgi:hypothetical protein
MASVGYRVEPEEALKTVVVGHEPGSAKRLPVADAARFSVCERQTRLL